MCAVVCPVIELIGEHRSVFPIPRKLLGEATGNFYVIVGVAIRYSRNLNELGTQTMKRILLFLALGFRYNDNRLHAQRIADHGQTDPRIARRTLDDHTAS